MKKVASTLGTFIIYIYFSILLSAFCKFILHMQLVSTNLEHIYWVNIICDLVFIISAAALNYKVLIKNDFDGKNIGHKILLFIGRLFLLFIIFMVIKVIIAVVLSWISAIFHLSAESNNQMLVEQIIKLHPVGMLISVCFCAPFMEEIIFRGSIRKVITNDWLFVATSGLLFGLVHVLTHQYLVIVLLIAAIFLNIIITSKMTKPRKALAIVITCIGMFIVTLLSLQLVSGNLIELIKNISISEAVNSLSYITMGLCLAYVYKRYNNIYLCMGLHAFNNIFGYVMIIFTMLIK